MLATFVADFLDAPPPGLNVAGTEKRVGQKGVGRTGRMLAHQLFQDPVLRQLPLAAEALAAGITGVAMPRPVDARVTGIIGFSNIVSSLDNNSHEA